MGMIITHDCTRDHACASLEGEEDEPLSSHYIHIRGSPTQALNRDRLPGQFQGIRTKTERKQASHCLVQNPTVLRILGVASGDQENWHIQTAELPDDLPTKPARGDCRSNVPRKLNEIA